MYQLADDARRDGGIARRGEQQYGCQSWREPFVDELHVVFVFEIHGIPHAAQQELGLAFTAEIDGQTLVYPDTDFGIVVVEVLDESGPLFGDEHPAFFAVVAHADDDMVEDVDTLVDYGLVAQCERIERSGR